MKASDAQLFFLLWQLFSQWRQKAALKVLP
jgi:hypothetical protein